MPSWRRASTACIRRCCGSFEPSTQGAAAHGKPGGGLRRTGVDPEAVPLLFGLGVTELSVVPALIPQLKALIRAPEARRLPCSWRSVRSQLEHRAAKCAR